MFQKKFSGFAKFSYYWGISWISLNIIAIIGGSGTEIIPQLILFGVVPFAYGLYNKIKYKPKIEQIETSKYENDILRLSISDDKVLTLTEVAVALKIPIDVAKIELDRMVERGLFVVEISENGSIKYINKDI